MFVKLQVYVDKEKEKYVEKNTVKIRLTFPRKINN